MRLSEHEQELLRLLHSKPSLGERLLGTAPDRIGILREISSLRNVAIVPAIASLALADDVNLARAAAATIDELLRGATDDTLAELDDWSRRHEMYYTYPSPDPWRIMQPAAVSGLHRFTKSEWAVVGFASFHTNGRVRETAVARLDELRSARTIPFLLLRVSDWVAPIAERARAAFERHLVPRESEELIAHIPLLLRVTVRRRRDTTDLRERVFTLLRDNSGPEVLANARRSSDRMTRRVAFRLSAERTGIDRVAILSEAQRERETAIRLDATWQVCTLDRETLLQVLPAFFADPFPKVRHSALALSVDSLGADADPFILSALVDENRTVRELARYAARQRALVSDFATFYRERAAAADSPRRAAAAVRGLGEVGTADDVLTIMDFLAHDQPRVRAAAAHALARLDESVAVELLPEMLKDAAPGVTHAVRDSLRRFASRVGAAKIAALLEGVETKHGRRDAFRLAAALSRWDALPLLIEGAADADEEIRTLARSALRRWLDEQNKTFVQPTRQQMQVIEAVLESRRLALQRSEVGALRSILRFWSA